MKLNEFNRESTLINQPSTFDIDISTRLGPEIVKHISALEALCKFMPNASNLLEQLNGLKQAMMQTVPRSSDVLEQSKVVEMYSTLHPKYGPSTWFAVAKSLQEQGYDKPSIDSMIDQSISSM